jgi:hypothetical protein
MSLHLGRVAEVMVESGRVLANDAKSKDGMFLAKAHPPSLSQPHKTAFEERRQE